MGLVIPCLIRFSAQSEQYWRSFFSDFSKSLSSGIPLGLLGNASSNARNPKLEVFDSKDVSNIAREWDFISFEQNSSLTDQNWPSSIQNHFFLLCELVSTIHVYTYMVGVRRNNYRGATQKRLGVRPSYSQGLKWPPIGRSGLNMERKFED